jgi:hypothetical protein
MLKALVVWLVGLVTLVPWATYYLFFRAERDQYALLITLILFWIFGYWSLVAPILTALKIRRLFRALERAQARGEAVRVLRSEDARDSAIDLIASENRIPRFLVARLYDRLVERALSRDPAADRGT